MARRRDERRKTRSRPPRAKSIEMVVAPLELKCPVAPDYSGDFFVWDLDKTYLRTEFESLRDLLRTAFQKAKDKEAYPGAAPLLRALRRGPGDTVRPIYFVSASPPQLAETIMEKFSLDGVEVDGVYFKDNMRNVRPGRFQRLREQMGYKLLALIDLRRKLPPGAVETTFGDDTETDAAVYSLYSEILQGHIGSWPLYEMLLKQGVFRDEALRIAWRARSVGRRAPVRRIFIFMHRSLDPRYFRRFGQRVTATRTHFQTAAALHEEGRITFDDVAAVAEETLARGAATPLDLGWQLDDLRRRNVLDAAHVAETMRSLRSLQLVAWAL